MKKSTLLIALLGFAKIMTAQNAATFSATNIILAQN
jgi:hypothetical protein